MMINLQGECGSSLGVCELSGDLSRYPAAAELPKKLLKRLQFEHLPGGVVPVILEKPQCDSCIAIVCGEIEIVDSTAFLHIKISDPSRSNIEQKSFPLSSYSIDDIVDLEILKIKSFLERKFFVKVRINAIPLDCDVYLNGVKVGNTPTELILENGNYRLSLEHEFCRVYRDSIAVLPGNDVDINATLKFNGYEAKPFLWGAVLLSAATAGVWITESVLHNQYLDLKKGSPEFNEYFRRYETANYIRIGLLNGAALSWTVSGFLSIKNRNLRKKLFSSFENH
jgi:hypothetical protein